MTTIFPLFVSFHLFFSLSFSLSLSLSLSLSPSSISFVFLSHGPSTHLHKRVGNVGRGSARMMAGASGWVYSPPTHALPAHILRNLQMKMIRRRGEDEGERGGERGREQWESEEESEREGEEEKGGNDVQAETMVGKRNWKKS